MDKARENHMKEMNRLQNAIKNTNSPYLISDYTKAYKRMERELKEYDMYKAVV